MQRPCRTQWNCCAPPSPAVLPMSWWTRRASSRAPVCTDRATRASHVAFLAPTQIRQNARRSSSRTFDLSSLRAICYGGAPYTWSTCVAPSAPFVPCLRRSTGRARRHHDHRAIAAQHARLLETGDARIDRRHHPYRRRGPVRRRARQRAACRRAGEVVVRGIS